MNYSEDFIKESAIPDHMEHPNPGAEQVGIRKISPGTITSMSGQVLRSSSFKFWAHA